MRFNDVIVAAADENHLVIRVAFYKGSDEGYDDKFGRTTYSITAMVEKLHSSRRVILAKFGQEQYDEVIEKLLIAKGLTDGADGKIMGTFEFESLYGIDSICIQRRHLEWVKRRMLRS
jgi:hypothetical protein